MAIFPKIYSPIFVVVAAILVTNRGAQAERKQLEEAVGIGLVNNGRMGDIHLFPLSLCEAVSALSVLMVASRAGGDPAQ